MCFYITMITIYKKKIDVCFKHPANYLRETWCRYSSTWMIFLLPIMSLSEKRNRFSALKSELTVLTCCITSGIPIRSYWEVHDINVSVRRRGEISHSYSNDYCVGRYYIYLDYSWSLYIWTVSAIRTLHNTECLHHVIPCFVRKSSAVWDGSCKWGSGLEAQAAVAYGSSFILGANTFVLLFLATDRVYKRFMYVIFAKIGIRYI